MLRIFIRETIFLAIFKKVSLGESSRSLRLQNLTVLERGKIYSRLTRFRATNSMVMSISTAKLCIFQPSLKVELYNAIMPCLSFDLLR